MGNRSTCCQPESPTGSTGRRVAPDSSSARNNNHNYHHNNNNHSRNSSSSKKNQYSNNTNCYTNNNNSSVNYTMGGGANHDNTVSSGYLSGYHHYASRDMDEMSSTWTRDETSNNLQHISEREPDDIDQDPSTHPTKGPLFMERSKSEIRIRDNRISMYFIQNHSAIGSPNSSYSPNNGATSKMTNGHHHKLIKSSSCSTIFLDDSTISQPNLRNTIKCISLAIYYHIANRKNRRNERLMDIFEERKHPIMSEPLSVDYELKDPEHKQIYRFIRVLFTSAQLTAECAIITLVYIERLLTYAEIDLCPSNWRRVVLGAIMLASKVWDDQAVWNVDYCQILRRCTVDDMNELERQFLECLEFNINVPSSVYAKYYFDLRTLAIANDLQMPLQPLYKERAKKLEALSKLYEDRYSDTQKKPRRRCNSADRLNNGSLKSPVVIP